MSFEDLAPKFGARSVPLRPPLALLGTDAASRSRADFEDDTDGTEVGQQKSEKKAGFIHVRVQQRNGRKCITTVQGLSDEVDPKKVIKAVKKARVPHARAHASPVSISPPRPRPCHAERAPRAWQAYCCNGTVVEDDEMGSVMQFQGDQRDNVINFLTQNGIVDKEKIKKHGMG